MSEALKRHSCPQCLEAEGVEIAYGMPSNETLELLDRGLIVLGGCVIREGGPKYQCLWCDHQWGEVTLGG